MPLHLRALIVVIIVAVISFAIIAPSAKKIIEPVDFRRWRNLWLALTCVGFLSGNFWLFALIAVLLIIFFSRREVSMPALFWLMLCVMPPMGQNIPGFGIINYLFKLSYSRLLCIAILLPVLFFGGKAVHQRLKNTPLADA